MTESSGDGRKSDRGKRLKKQPSRQSSRIMFGCQHCDCLHYQRDDDNDPPSKGNSSQEKDKGEGSGVGSQKDVEEGDKSLSKGTKGRKRQKLRKDTEEEEESESPCSSERYSSGQVSDPGMDLLSEKSEAGSDLGLDENGSKAKPRKKKGSHGEEVEESKTRNDSLGGGSKSAGAKGDKAEKAKNIPCLCGHSHQDHCKSKPNPFTKKKSSVSLDNLSVMDQIGEVFAKEDTGFLRFPPLFSCFHLFFFSV